MITIDFEADWGGRVDSINAVNKMTGPLLEALDEAGTRATFFVSTEIASRAANWLKLISAQGHEIASHGHRHYVQYDKLTTHALRKEIKDSKAILEDICSVKVFGFRTPMFRKHKDTEEVLMESGYLYDSSSVEVGLMGRYKKAQYINNVLPEFQVGSIKGYLPAGIKWMNLYGNRAITERGGLIYVHLFDLMTLNETLRSYSPEVGKKALLFYLARRGSPLSTLKRALKPTRSLQEEYSDILTTVET